MSITKAYEKVVEQQLMEELKENAEVYMGEGDVYIDSLIEELLTEKEELFEYLAEELTDDEKYKADRLRDTGHSYYNEAFTSMHPAASAMFDKHAMTEGRGRIRIPLTLNTEDMPPNNLVKQHLNDHGWDIHDYRQGLAKKTIKTGNPENGIPITNKVVHKKIGKILDETGAQPDVKKKFMNDPTRSSSTNQEFDMVLSHHHHDVYGMSTGRGWVSCSTMRKGCEKFNGNGPAAQKMKEEINGQTHVAYLLPKGGNVHTDAIARLAFKRHSPIGGGKDTLISENTVYGTAPNDFRQKANEEVGKLFHVESDKTYYPSNDHYRDSGYHFRFGGDDKGQPSPESIDAAWKTLNHRDVKGSSLGRHQLFSKIDPEAKYKSRKLNDIANVFMTAKAHGNAGNFTEAVSTLGDFDVPEQSDTMHLMGRGFSGKDNKVDAALQPVINSFDVNNPEHLELAKQFNEGRKYHYNHVQRHVVSSAIRNEVYKPIKTVDDAVRVLSIRQNMPNDRHQRFVFDDKHKLGANPAVKIAHGLAEKGMLNTNTVHHMFFGLGDKRKRGNLYDFVSELHNAGVPGTDAVVKQIVNDRSDKYGEKGIAEMLYRTKPANRQLWADAHGVDHKELIKKYGKEFRQKDAEINALIAKAKAEQNKG